MVHSKSIGKLILAALFFIVLFNACAPARRASKSVSNVSRQPQDTVVAVIEQDTVQEEVMDTVAIVEIETELEPEVPGKADTIRIIGVGDIMLGTNFPKESYLPPNQGKDLLREAEEVLQSADLAFGNLEGVILDGEGDPKKCKNPDACYLFRMPAYMATNLQEAGFDMLSLANNHAGDFGDEGRESTMHILDSIGIYHAGQLKAPYCTFQKENTTYGFVAFSPNNGTLSINDHEYASEIVQKLDSICDIVIVSFHGGAEGKDHQHVTKEQETFYRENRGNVYAFSHDMIDAGADIIFGHGPHVVRAIEIYKKRLISYSLGNFSTYARFNISGPNRLAPAIEVRVNETGEFLNGKIHSFVQTGAGYPVKDPEHNAAKKIRELTREDLPEAEIIIDDQGNINYINNDI